MTQKREHRGRQISLLIASFCGLLCLWGVSEVSAARLKMRGYAETRYSYLLGQDFGGLCDKDLSKIIGKEGQERFDRMCNPNLLYYRLRPSFKVPFGRKARLRATFNVLHGNFGLARDIKEITDILTLERFYLDLRYKFVDVRMGKQFFNWGPAQLWSLTTPYVPQNPTDMNAELPGLWAVSANITYRDTGLFKVAVMASPDFKNSLEFIRWKDTFKGNDFAITVLDNGSKERLSIGAEWKGELKVGLWLEGAVHIPYKDGEKPTFAFVAGLDYTFNVVEGLYIMLQYYYNHSGFTDSDEYPINTASGQAELAKQLQNPGGSQAISGIGLSIGGESFLARHYLLLMARLTINEDVNVSLMGLMNLVDFSAMVAPTISWTFLDNFNINAGVYFLVGPDGSEFHLGKIKIDALEMLGASKEGVSFMPTAVLFAWLKYSF